MNGWVNRSKALCPCRLAEIASNVEALGIYTASKHSMVAFLEGQKQQQAQVLAEARLRCEQRGVKPATLLRRGNAGKEIVEVAKELGCDLIVVGSRKLSMIGAIARGSVSDYVMRHAEVDVLIVH